MSIRLLRENMDKTGMKKTDIATSFWIYSAYIISICFVVITVFPIAWMVISSFKTQSEIMLAPLSPPKNPTFQNYSAAWGLGDMGRKFFNSIIYTVFSTVFTVIFSLSSGFALAKFPYRSRKIYYGMFTTGLLITVNSVVIPLFIMENVLGLYNHYLGVILPYIAFALPTSVLIATSYLRALPDTIIEAARIDGADYLQIFLFIVIPMCVPVITTIAILSFLQDWNEFLLAFILTTGESLKSLPVAVNSFAGRLVVNYGLQLAALTLATLPMIIFYLFFNKYLIASFAQGGIKE